MLHLPDALIICQVSALEPRAVLTPDAQIICNPKPRHFCLSHFDANFQLQASFPLPSHNNFNLQTQQLQLKQFSMLTFLKLTLISCFRQVQQCTPSSYEDTIVTRCTVQVPIIVHCNKPIIQITLLPLLEKKSTLNYKFVFILLVTPQNLSCLGQIESSAKASGSASI